MVVILRARPLAVRVLLINAKYVGSFSVDGAWLIMAREIGTAISCVSSKHPYPNSGRAELSSEFLYFLDTFSVSQNDSPPCSRESHNYATGELASRKAGQGTLSRCHVVTIVSSSPIVSLALLLLSFPPISFPRLPFPSSPF